MWNKKFCSLAAPLVSLACLIGIARCLEAFLCVSYVTDVIWFLWMIVLWRGVAIYLQSVKYRGTQQSAANLPPLPHFTVHFPQRRPPGSVSHSTPDVNSPPDLGSIQNNYAQFHRQMARTDRSDCESLLFFFLICFQGARMAHMQLLVKFGEHRYLQSLCLIDRQGITYRQMSTVIANWLLIHGLNTMFCVEGSVYITAITVSRGSQCANRFYVFFSPFG